MVVLFVTVMGLSGGGVWLEEGCHWGKALDFHSLVSLPVLYFQTAEAEWQVGLMPLQPCFLCQDGQ